MRVELAPLNDDGIRTASPALELTTELYEAAFPQNEKRPWPRQLILLNEQKLQLLQIQTDSQFAGFIFYWPLTDFVFIEHFAVMPALRGRGIGGKAMLAFALLHPVIVLETQNENSNEHAAARIGFYERLNYQIFAHPYSQPPYEAGGSYIDMHLMHNMEVANEVLFNKIKNEIYSSVYQATV